MSKENISFSEAKMLLTNQNLYSNRLANLASYEHFPPLNNHSSEKTQNVTQTRGQTIDDFRTQSTSILTHSYETAATSMMPKHQVVTQGKSHPIMVEPYNKGNSPHFQTPRNVSNSFNFPNSPITSSPIYSKNTVNENTKPPDVKGLKYLVNLILTNIISSEIPVNMDILKESNIDLIVETILKNKNIT